MLVLVNGEPILKIDYWHLNLSQSENPCLGIQFFEA